MADKRIAVIGAGRMARVRGQAFLATGRALVCAVASRRRERAQACAAELGCAVATDAFRRVLDTSPDAVLVELPHLPQDEVVLWALEAGLDVLIGGALASSLESAQHIVERCAHHGRVVEVGYQRRYDPAWEETRRVVAGGDLGEPILAVSMALWRADPATWYYDQAISGGMPLTHLSYCYLNALRWVLGKPLVVQALANRKRETGAGRVLEETCALQVGFASGAIAAATASYAAPAGMADAETRFLCTAGGIQVDSAPPPGTTSITLFTPSGAQTRRFPAAPSPFVRQAHAFLDALESRGAARNPPADALWDVRLAAAVSAAAQRQQSVPLP